MNNILKKSILLHNNQKNTLFSKFVISTIGCNLFFLT